MAVDEAIAQSVREGRSLPTFRVYEWSSPAVSIGCFQRIDSVDLRYCSERNIPVIRRLTGGRAIFHCHELTYSLSAPTTTGLFASGLMDSYKKISRAFCRAISLLGLSPEMKTVRERDHGRGEPKSPLCFQSTSFSEITLSQRKVVGSAQKCWRDGFLQQGTIPYTIDEDEVRRIFTIDSTVDLSERMMGMHEAVPGLSGERLKEVLRVSLEETFEVVLTRASLSPEERLLARHLEALRYLCPDWNLQK